MTRDLNVYLHGEAVGILRQASSGRLRFSYDAARLARPDARPISIALPLRKEPFDDRHARPFFAGLLPDDLARDRLARYLRVSRRNDFALLAEVGGECAGAISLYPPGSAPPRKLPEDLKHITESSLAALLRDLPTRPLLAGGELRLSLAGAQDKMALVVKDGAFFLPRGDVPTTHILKPAIAPFSETVPNEFFCMRLAAAVGIEVPQVSMETAEDVPFLVVERYDRARDEIAGIRRIHQEDFCQALAIPPEQKYQAEGGPSLAQCFELLAACRRPALARLEMLRRTLFNALVGNADAHGKNFALLHFDGGSELSPAYDIVCTAVYPELTDRLAMKIGGKNRFEKIWPRHWERFARDAGLSPPRVRRDLLEMAGTLPVKAQHLAGELSRAHRGELAIVQRVVEVIDARCRRVRRSFDNSPPSVS